MGALLFGIIMRAQNVDTKQFFTDDEPEAAAAPMAPGLPALPAITFGERPLGLPEGCTVTEMRPDRERLYLHTGPKGLCERIVIVDSLTGRVLGTLTVSP